MSADLHHWSSTSWSRTERFIDNYYACRHHLPKLEELALANCGTVEKREVLRQHLAALDAAELSTLVCRQLRFVFFPACSPSTAADLVIIRSRGS